jgi:hypothetical protein
VPGKCRVARRPRQRRARQAFLLRRPQGWVVRVFTSQAATIPRRSATMSISPPPPRHPVANLRHPGRMSHRAAAASPAAPSAWSAFRCGSCVVQAGIVPGFGAPGRRAGRRNTRAIVPQCVMGCFYGHTARNNPP